MTEEVDLTQLPILPLKNSVMFPAASVPVNVGRPRSVRLLEELVKNSQRTLGVFGQRLESDDPLHDSLYEIGTLARIVRVIRLAPGNYSVVLHGIGRIRREKVVEDEPFLRAQVSRVASVLDGVDPGAFDHLQTMVRDLVAEMPSLPKDFLGSLEGLRDPGVLADRIASNFSQEQLSLVEKQDILSALDVSERVKKIEAILKKQLDLQKMRREVTEMVANEGKSQREEVLREQMRSIKEELGEADSDDDLDQLRDRVRKAQMSDEALKIARKQLARLSGIQPQSAEYNVTRTYVEWLSDLPWQKTTDDKLEVEDVRRCLDEDHYGLEKVKKRIVEYVAVRKLRKDKRGPILCFIGPPGVGKTSLGKSIARAMGRRYHRIALGGVRDESEIRGHRRTYVGALPGRIIQALKKVEVKNPVFVLDELDKMGSDNHGDPAAALLEVLDPAQNDTFGDHYIDTPFDLSKVTFIATANTADTIPGPLYDRLEVIEVAGYTRMEKRSIAREYLAPKQLSLHGLTPEHVEFHEKGFETIVDHYTREAGVRGLEREIASICRAVAMHVAEGTFTSQIIVDRDFVEKVLGPLRYHREAREERPQPGVVAGLAWTPAGGDILFVEVQKMPGNGAVMVTGNLKSVMTESAQAAVSYVRSKAERLHLDPDFMKSIDLHIHFPKGGTPKDGPSAGVTMFTAITSLLLNAPVRSDIAMTGEISLRGNVLPVGGIKEKLLAAHRAGMSMVLIPHQNERDLDDLPPDVRKELDVRLIKKMEEILPLVLLPPEPEAVPADDASSTSLG